MFACERNSSASEPQPAARVHVCAFSERLPVLPAPSSAVAAAPSLSHRPGSCRAIRLGQTHAPPLRWLPSTSMVPLQSPLPNPVCIGARQSARVCPSCRRRRHRRRRTIGHLFAWCSASPGSSTLRCRSGSTLKAKWTVVCTQHAPGGSTRILFHPACSVPQLGDRFRARPCAGSLLMRVRKSV